MPLGIIINCGSVAVGGLLGKPVGMLLPTRVCEYLSRFFGISSIVVGVSLIQKSTSLSAVLVLICSGSMGLMGAMTEAMTGDPSILITKSVLDLFGAAIFASSLGISIALISVPQFLLYMLLYKLAGLIMPLVSPQMLADFMCCGGVIALVTGIRVAEIKAFRVASLLPALLLVMPLSALWGIIVHKG